MPLMVCLILEIWFHIGINPFAKIYMLIYMLSKLQIVINSKQVYLKQLGHLTPHYILQKL